MTVTEIEITELEDLLKQEDTCENEVEPCSHSVEWMMVKNCPCNNFKFCGSCKILIQSQIEDIVDLHCRFCGKMPLEITWRPV